MLSKAVNHK